MSILERIGGPVDLARLSMEERLSLVDEIRKLIIDTISQTGGHLASSLGVVELTVAILSVFTPPRDKVIWDVGHQSYPWKLLTGRADRFDTIRTRGGLSGFQKRSESEYDAFGAGHSSTSISAALGYALARDISGDDYKVAAVIGDGAMGGGMALEGLNHLGHDKTSMLIILNDNEMSISPNVGAISTHLTRLMTDPRYNRIKQEVWKALGRIPSLGERMRNAAHAVSIGLKKALVTPDTLFDAFGVRYIGPVPGNDLAVMTGVLQRVSEIPGPVLLHVLTKKGKGYVPAEKDATRYHGVSGSARGSRRGETFTEAFSKAMVSLAEKDDGVVAITAAMPDGTGLVEFSRRFPERFFDVGIAEQHAVTMACGMAFGGLKPVVAVYSTFMQRAVDQVIHDAALQKAPIVVAMDRGGLVGEDGPTHHGVFDISIFLSVPNVRFGAPRNCSILEIMLERALDFETGPTLLRYPRGEEPSVIFPDPGAVEPGKGQLLREGEDVLLVGVGVMASHCMEAAELLEKSGISAAVYDPVWLKPAPADELKRLASGGKPVVVVEEGSVAGGFGCMVDFILDGTSRVLRIGVPDDFQPHGRRADLLVEIGLDPESIARRVGDEIGS